MTDKNKFKNKCMGYTGKLVIDSVPQIDKYYDATTALLLDFLSYYFLFQ